MAGSGSPTPNPPFAPPPAAALAPASSALPAAGCSSNPATVSPFPTAPPPVPYRCPCPNSRVSTLALTLVLAVVLSGRVKGVKAALDPLIVESGRGQTCASNGERATSEASARLSARVNEREQGRVCECASRSERTAVRVRATGWRRWWRWHDLRRRVPTCHGKGRTRRRCGRHGGPPNTYQARVRHVHSSCEPGRHAWCCAGYEVRGVGYGLCGPGLLMRGVEALRC